METLKFKTNIKCDGCVATVKPHLDKLENINWQVDLADPDRILTVQGEHPEAAGIIDSLAQAGYKAEVVK